MLNDVGETIYINGRFLCHQTTGVQRYARELLRALDEEIFERYSGRCPSWATVLIPKGAAELPRYRCLSVKQVGRLSGSMWEQIELPYFSRKGTLINLSNIAPILRRRQIVVIHDAAVFAAPAGYSLAFKVWYRFAHSAISQRAAQIVTVSEFSRRELAGYLSLEEDQIAVIPNGSDHAFEIPATGDLLVRHGLTHHEFTLVVGSLHPNKNVGSAIRAALALGPNSWPVVIVGASNSRVFSSTDISENLKGEKVIFMGRVSDAELSMLYRFAGCLLFPSLYEGFGIPPLEAMRHGCPVVTSNVASMPEVCGEAALYVDPASIDSITKALGRMQADPGLRASLSAAGKKRAQHYLWRDSARKLIDEVSRVTGACSGT